eukprot:TRINITY_DN47121_c0_g1_i1.p1 TRINITY_DN47121_c0_g1~~TRINITY_DN47121_c0_g1_i1.p1  ORF type:complete len:418 (-),score=109.68 TRINITY_DN47121_c0_g1_i1:130-1317(-)
MVARLVKWLLKGESASEYKNRVETQIAALEPDAEVAPGGRAWHQLQRLRAEPRYLDACKVVAGRTPTHGYFHRAEQQQQQPQQQEGSQRRTGTGIDSEEAARLAHAAEQALAELASSETPESAPAPASVLPLDEEALLQRWCDKAKALEAKVAASNALGPISKVAGIGMNEIDELETLAQEVVDYKDRLRASSGYSNKDFKENRELCRLEDRLDVLARRLLPAAESGQTASEAGAAESGLEPARAGAAAGLPQLTEQARRLAARVVRCKEQTAGLCPSEVRELEKLLLEVAERKAHLRAEGLTEHEQDRDEQVMNQLIRLRELRLKEHHDKKRAKNGKKEEQELLAELEQLQEQLAAFKRSLRGEHGCSNKDVKHDPEVCELEERLIVLKKFGGA